MALPRQVQADLDAADALHARVYPVDAHEVQLEATPPVPAEDKPVPVEASPQPAVVETPHPVEDWEQKFRTLQGKYNAEVPRLHQMLKERDGSLQDVTQRVQQLEQASAPPDTKLVTDEDTDLFGADQVDFTRRVARDEIATAIRAAMADLRAEFAHISGQVQTVAQSQAETAESMFWGDIRKRVQGWDELDSDPSWHQWLDTAPEYTDDTYRTLAMKAVRAGDVGRVVALVRLFRGNDTPTAPAPKLKASPELARQVTPATVSGTPTPVSERVWSRADYEAAYDPRNLRRMSESASLALQAEADRALADGRVRF